MYHNYGTPMKGQIVNLDDKQIVFPEDDDSDIIIVNEDYSRNAIDGQIRWREDDDDDLLSTTEKK